MHMKLMTLKVRKKLISRPWRHFLLKPTSITLAGSEMVRGWFELKFGLSYSLLAVNSHELAGSRPNSITLSGSKLVRTDSVMEFGFEPAPNQLACSQVRESTSLQAVQSASLKADWCACWRICELSSNPCKRATVEQLEIEPQSSRSLGLLCHYATHLCRQHKLKNSQQGDHSFSTMIFHDQKNEFPWPIGTAYFFSK